MTNEEQEEHMAAELGAVIGYGGMMRLGQKLWRQSLIEQGLTGGGAFSIGPCMAFMVPCRCVERQTPAHQCDWCDGSKEVTKRVRAAIDEVEQFRSLIAQACDVAHRLANELGNGQFQRINEIRAEAGIK